jgi:amino acid adenylation domain-containing protein
MEYLLHHLLQASAAAYPNRPAVVDGARTMLFSELESRANQLAHFLIQIGVSRGDRVGLYLDKSLESLVGIYGALKVGAAYVPLDPQAPAARLAYIARDCDIRCLLTGKEKGKALNGLMAAGAPLETVIVLNAAAAPVADVQRGVRVFSSQAIDEQPQSVPEEGTIHLDLAYILYTSGSTGVPKGVMLSHLNALTFVDWTVDEFGVRPHDRLSSHAPLHFDLSIFDIFAAAKAGAAVVLVPPAISVFPAEVSRFIRKNEISIWYSVPSILNMLTLRGNLKVGDFPDLRTMLFAGEVFPTKYLRHLMQLLPHVRFFNLYGPTETNVCTYYEVPSLAEGRVEPIPIGKPIPNVEVIAVTRDGGLCAPGEIGELYVRGSTVMQGYWGDPERTANVLSSSPRGDQLHDPVYGTGDLVQEDQDGNYRFLGRRDAQIKTRGYRIELGEIETTLYAHPAVVECAVVAIPDELVTNRIKAYVVPRDHLQEADLIRFCSERIPRYMIPETFEFLEALPKTSTGKIDRQALSRAKATVGGRHAN